MRSTTTVAVLAACLTLSGCVPFLPPLNRPQEPSISPSSSAFSGELEVGACLSAVRGYDSDRDSLVPCTEPHRYDVVEIAEWPGMEGAIAASNTRVVWETITGNSYNAEPEPDGYTEWADRTCADAVRDLVGWDTLSIDGISADDLWLMPAGTFDIDNSLADQKAFAAGDRRTVCSVMWSEPIEFDEGISVEQLASPGMPIEARECIAISQDGYIGWTGCETRHEGQTILRFEARAALGDAALVAPERMTESTIQRIEELCTEGVENALGPIDPDFFAWGDRDLSRPWTFDAEGRALPGARYFIVCGVARNDLTPHLGDAFDKARQL